MSYGKPSNSQLPSEEQNLKYAYVKSLIISIGMILLCPVLIIILAEIAPYVDQNDYNYVSGNFAEALMRNNSSLARRLSLPSQWDRIDVWMSTHEPFTCPLSLDFDDNQSFIVSGMEEDEAHVSFFHLCWVKEYSYEFKIEVILRRQGNRWQVVDWNEVEVRE
jgi:hypothetical protein